MQAAIDGKSYVPLRTFTYGEGNAARAVRVVQNLFYWLTLLDCGANGLLPRRPAGDDGGNGKLLSQFRMCLSVVNTDKCLKALLESSLSCATTLATFNFPG